MCKSNKKIKTIVVIYIHISNFLKSLSAENARPQQEMDFQLKLIELENQWWLQERKHEIQLFSLLMGNNMQARNTTQPFPHYQQHVPKHFGSFPQYLPNTSSHQHTMHMSRSSECTSVVMSSKSGGKPPCHRIALTS